MDRRTFVGNVVGGFLVAPLAARAQKPAMPVIGFLHSDVGFASGTWSRRLIGKSASLHGTIGLGGTVAVTLDGWSAKDGAPLTGALNGRVVDSRIDIEGPWANGLRVDGHWTRTP